MPEAARENKNAANAARKNKLLIVDDEDLFLKILIRMFEKRYELRTATSGEEGIEVLESGFKPEVIISDQRMQGISGAEFLEKSIHYAPGATRIILTGYSNPKDIIACINQGKAYMYLTKPAEEIQLVQAVKIAVDYYNSNQKNRVLAAELKKSLANAEKNNKLLDKSLLETQQLFAQAVQVISGLSTLSERYYFNSHSKNIAVIAKALAEMHGLTPDRIQLVMVVSLLVNSVTLDMPKKFILHDPNDLSDEDSIIAYMNSYMKNLELISKVGMLNVHSEVLSQLWERYDGSGHPKGLSGKHWAIEAQIIAMARFYHNAVYRITPEQMSELNAKGVVKQSFKTTMQRHQEAVKMYYRRAGWFELDIFNDLHDLIKKKSCPSLVPENKELEIINPDFDPDEAALFQKETHAGEAPAGSDTISASVSTGEVQLVEKEIKVEELQAGMVIGQNVVTKNGILVVRQDNTLDATLVRNIQNLGSAGMVPGYITIMVPKG